MKGCSEPKSRRPASRGEWAGGGGVGRYHQVRASQWASLARQHQNRSRSPPLYLNPAQVTLPAFPNLDHSNRLTNPSHASSHTPSQTSRQSIKYHSMQSQFCVSTVVILSQSCSPGLPTCRIHAAPPPAPPPGPPPCSVHQDQQEEQLHHETVRLAWQRRATHTTDVCVQVGLTE